MKRVRKLSLVLVSLALLGVLGFWLLVGWMPVDVPGIHPDWIEMPEGFSATVFSKNVPGARSLAQNPDGIVFVGTRKPGVVYALEDTDGDGQADRTYTLATGLNSPNGVAWHDGTLYVAEIHRILAFDNIDARLDNPPAPRVVYDKLPTDPHHGWKFIAFGPDGRLYVPIGAPGNNVLRKDDRRFSAITRMQPDGSEFEIYAEGVRNTVGFDWHPDTDELWFTENGRDWMGDDGPPDELNHAPRAGMHFGYPYWHGRGIRDDEFTAGKKREDTVEPVLELGPHVAALGMRFYRGTMFPAHYRDSIFIAEHGSWNRTIPSGYRITRAHKDEAGLWHYKPFATGWQKGPVAWGRPVDVLVRADGSLLVSDDRAGAVFRIIYAAP